VSDFAVDACVAFAGLEREGELLSTTYQRGHLGARSSCRPMSEDEAAVEELVAKAAIALAESITRK